MANVVLDMAMSLDGFISGPNDEDQGLHNYFFAPVGPTVDVIEAGFRKTGTIILGRRTYEIGAAQDGFVDNPYPVPHFVITHTAPDKPAPGAESFKFITDGIERALEQAKAVTGERDVVIGGGADIARQTLNAGLIDEIQIHLVHKLLGEGLRLFDQTRPMELEQTRLIDSTGVTHLTFRVLR